MKVLLTSSKSEEYPRISQLMGALKSLGHEVEHLHIPLKSAFFYGPKEKNMLRSKDVDLIVCGFFGQHAVRICRKNQPGVPVILDAFVSAYQTLVKDRKDKRFLLAAPFVKLFEKKMLSFSDSIITDTQFHLEYFAKKYGVPEEKFSVMPVSSRFEGLMSTDATSFEQRDKVHFHGEIQRFHGLEEVSPSINSLAAMGIITSLYLGEKGQKWSKKHSKKLDKRVRIFTKNVSYLKLRKSMESSLATLGIFRKSEKADLVIPNKVVESLSLGIPCITLSTISTRNLVKNIKSTKNYAECGLILVDEPSGVTNAIKALMGNEELWRRSSDNAKKLYKEVFNSRNNERMLGNLIQEVVDVD